MRTLLIFFTALFLSQHVIAGESQQQGRYQIILNPAVRADTLLLDTWTGKVWHKVQFTDMYGEPVVWEIMDKIDGLEDQKKWSKNHFSKEEAEKFIAKEKEKVDQNQQQK